MSTSERKMIARIASNESWAKTADRPARTAPARAALRSKWEREVDPDGVLAPEELARRVESKRKAHYQRMALKSAQVRRKTKGPRAADEGGRGAVA